MTSRRVAACAVAIGLAVIAADPMAQSLVEVDAQLDLIVGIEPPDGTPGSGVIIAVEEERVRILTAKHVIEGDVATPEAADQKVRRACDRSPVEVRFQFDREHPVKSVSADCTDLIDMAVVEVVKPSSFPNTIPRFATAPASPGERPQYQVSLAGLAEGTSWTPLSGDSVREHVAVASRPAAALVEKEETGQRIDTASPASRRPLLPAICRREESSRSSVATIPRPSSKKLSASTVIRSREVRLLVKRSARPASSVRPRRPPTI